MAKTEVDRNVSARSDSAKSDGKKQVSPQKDNNHYNYVCFIF